MDKVKQIELRKIRNAILIILLLLVIIFAAFFVFVLKVSTHNALREAKNISLDLELISVEFYGKGKSLYNPNHENGLENGVMERLESLIGEEVDVKITAYDRKSRHVQGFIYENDEFRVKYTMDKEGVERYEIDKLFHVASYEY